MPGHSHIGQQTTFRGQQANPKLSPRALKLAAMGLSLSRCAMGAYYRRLALRMGSPKAITAVAHKLARIVYAMLSGQADYVKEEQVRHDARYRERAIKALQKRAQELDLTLSPQAVPAHA
ncbi:MAG: hypothetical protein Q8K74_04290 [Candidatus Nitrotoga sp.]|nr:hypothetical protein [Candidatus Nitrotoga sp.]